MKKGGKRHSKKRVRLAFPSKEEEKKGDLCYIERREP